MHWIKTPIFFPRRTVKYQVGMDVVNLINLDWHKKLNEDTFVLFLEALFNLLVEKEIIPKETQVHQTGKDLNTNCVYFVVSHNSFDEVEEGFAYPIKMIRPSDIALATANKEN